jgi:hypothetical protein
MTPHDSRAAWLRLTSAARQVQDTRDTAAPYGFATRVVAGAFSTEFRDVSLAERFALRAVGVAGLLAALSVALNYSALTNVSSTTADEEVLPADDAVALVLNLND